MLNLLSSSLPAIIDIVVVILILLFAILGFAKGFINTFLKSFGSLISLILSVLLCATVVNFLSEQFFVGATIAERLVKTVNKIFGEELMSQPLGSASELSLKDSGVAGWIIKNLFQIKDNGAYPEGTTLGGAISQIFAYYILIAIVFVVLFIIFKVLCFLIMKFAIKMQERKMVGTADRVLGLFLGLIMGISFVQGTLFAIQSLPIGFIQDLSLAIDNSVITNFISNINLYSVILDSIKKIIIR